MFKYITQPRELILRKKKITFRKTMFYHMNKTKIKETSLE